MAFAFVRRTAQGHGLPHPDKDHVHHRLLRLGHGPRRTVVILWAWTALLSGFVLYPLFASKANAVIPFGVVVLGLVLYTLFHPGLRRRNAPPVEGGEVESPGAQAPGPGPGALREARPRAPGAQRRRGLRRAGRGGPATPRESNGAYGVPLTAPVVPPR